MLQLAGYAHVIGSLDPVRLRDRDSMPRLHQLLAEVPTRPPPYTPPAPGPEHCWPTGPTSGPPGPTPALGQAWAQGERLSRRRLRLIVFTIDEAVQLNGGKRPSLTLARDPCVVSERDRLQRQIRSLESIEQSLHSNISDYQQRIISAQRDRADVEPSQRCARALQRAADRRIRDLESSIQSAETRDRPRS